MSMLQEEYNLTDEELKQCYNYAVIEGYEEGFYPVAELTKWFKYDAKSDKAFEIEPPLHNNVRGYAF